MNLFDSLADGLVPTVFASSIEQLGSGTPGIDAMWGMIKSVFPHTDKGSGGLTFILLQVTNIMLQLIAGAAVLVMIYAGIRMVIGNDEGLGEAKKVIMYCIIGLIGALCADAVVLYTMSIVGAAAGA